MSTTEYDAGLKAVERKLTKIKSQIDQFEEYFKIVRSGYGDKKLLNDKHHNLIISTKDLLSHLVTIQKMIEGTSQNRDLRVFGQNLHSQAIKQLSRLRSVGIELQQFSISQDKTLPPPYMDKGGSNVTDIFGNENPFAMDQKTLSTAHLELDARRAQEMEQLEADIVQVNELFTTLNTYVHDQGQLVDSIGDNIEVAYEQVHAGSEQLNKAVKHRLSARRKKCFCLSFGLALLFIICLIIGLSFR